MTDPIVDEVHRIMRDEFPSFGFVSHQFPTAIGMWPNEQESLLWLALSAPAGNWMEIGSFCGGSTVLLCLARRGLTSSPSVGAGRVECPLVYSVDVTFSGWNGEFKRNVYRVGQFQDISRCIECDSKDLAKHYDGSPLSFVFMDGWHSYAAICRDFETVEPWLVPGAILAFHDTAPQPYKPGQIAAFYAESVAHHEEWVGEGHQDFRIDEAIARIIHTKGYEYIEIPVIDGSTHFDRVPEYRRGTTSPWHGLVAIRKPL